MLSLSILIINDKDVADPNLKEGVQSMKFKFPGSIIMCRDFHNVHSLATLIPLQTCSSICLCPGTSLACSI